LTAQEHNGSGGLTDVAANGNVLSIRARSGGVLSTAWLVDVEGDVVQQGTLSVNSTLDSTSLTTGSITTSGGVGIGKDLQVGGALSAGSNALTSGAYSADTVEIQDLAVSTSTTLFAGIKGTAGEFDAFTVSVVIRTNSGPTAEQRDLYWVSSNGTTVTITSLAAESAGTAGVTYSLSVSGNDLVISHSEAGKTVDVVAAMSGLRSVSP
jgi:hypothetical protein